MNVHNVVHIKYNPHTHFLPSSSHFSLSLHCSSCLSPFSPLLLFLPLLILSSILLLFLFVPLFFSSFSSSSLFLLLFSSCFTTKIQNLTKNICHFLSKCLIAFTMKTLPKRKLFMTCFQVKFYPFQANFSL